jgi:hypothetical protein
MLAKDKEILFMPIPKAQMECGVLRTPYKVAAID